MSQKKKKDEDYQESGVLLCDGNLKLGDIRIGKKETAGITVSGNVQSTCPHPILVDEIVVSWEPVGRTGAVDEDKKIRITEGDSTKHSELPGREKRHALPALGICPFKTKHPVRLPIAMGNPDTQRELREEARFIVAVRWYLSGQKYQQCFEIKWSPPAKAEPRASAEYLGFT